MITFNAAVKRVALLSLVFTSLAPHTMAGCGVNFDKMRKRRIEAIRGQILSKLGLTQLPNNDSRPTGSIPRDVEIMYNRTRDFVLEQARQKRVECEEPEENYYAQDIVTIKMKPNEDNQSKPMENKKYKAMKMQKELSEFFEFDLSSSNIDPDAIVSASLRLYQVQIPGTPHGPRQQVELFQLSPPQRQASPPEMRFLTMRLMDTYGQGWHSFDVTSSVREWVRIPKMNQGLELTVSCSNDEVGSTQNSNFAADNKQLKITFAGSTGVHRQSQQRGDQQGHDIVLPDFPDEYNPHLVLMVRTPNSQSQSTSHKRRKRALDAEYCFRRNPTESNCCLRELFIDFRKDLGWNWIFAPSGYRANFCAGACPYLWSMDTQHATILSLYKSMNPRASSSPCCAPKDLEPLTIMYYNKGRYKFTQMSDMVLVSCKCS